MQQEINYNTEENNQPVTVLGKTFTNDDERREWFRNELRKKLPELKQMDGFPIGEDEDIIKLSDPPYYTACPNPWLNEFINEWEKEKKELEKQGLRTSDEEFVVDEPYASDVSEGKNNPIYNAHSYHTKVPHPAIMRYIMHYTQPGDIIFDGFAGTGMTGVAASMCDKPDLDIRKKIESENLNAKWGNRNAVCTDLSPIASLINSILNVSGNSRESFLKDSTSLIQEVEKKYEWIYKTKHNQHEYGTINYIVWSEVFICPHCNADINFWYSAVNGLAINETFNCHKCNSKLTKRDLLQKWDTKYDDFSNESIQQLCYEPVFINYRFNKKLYEKPLDDYDIENIKKINDFSFTPIPQLYNTIQEGDKTREFFNKGITNLSDLYTKRTLILLTEIYKLSRTKEQKALFTAAIVNLSKTARYKFKRSGNVPMSGTIYVSSLIAESNVFNVFKSKIKAFQNAFNILGNNQHNINGINSAIALNNLKSNSFDYIFVDPPFGANLMYSELSAHWENWLNIKTNTSSEAIENKTQKKNIYVYQQLLNDSFNEFYRILKPGKWMTVEFSNTKAAVWNSIQNSITKSGFVIANTSALDKKQKSYNAVMNPTSVKQDLIISCYKPSNEFDEKFRKTQNTEVGIWDFIEEHLNHLKVHLIKQNATTAIIERSPKILFDRLIAFYVTRNLPVPIDAVAFQNGLKERFIERDGMFFSPIDAEKYDKKKSLIPKFIQLNIFVSNEQDAIYWLRQKLEDPKTEADLHPMWMTEVVSNIRKGDSLPEMRHILEENFLKDDNGKWYIPNMENEADLEKARIKRLLKIFDGYKVVIAKPRAKLNEVRVEALRAGFKQCYQDKDFKTIIAIGDRIPNNLLMEDEVLLQYYDIASSRV